MKELSSMFLFNKIPKVNKNKKQGEENVDQNFMATVRMFFNRIKNTMYFKRDEIMSFFMCVCGHLHLYSGIKKQIKLCGVLFLKS